MPTFGSTSVAITLSFDFDIIYNSEHIINNSFFCFQYGSVNVHKPMQIRIAPCLSHSGCISECCCPSRMSLVTPFCPMGTLSCAYGLRWVMSVFVIELHQQHHRAEQSQRSRKMDHNWEPPNPGHGPSLSWDSMLKYILKRKELYEMFTILTACVITIPIP